MTPINTNHVAAGGAGAALTVPGLTTQIGQFLIDHGVAATSAYNDAGLIISAAVLICTGVWAMVRKRDPKLAGELVQGYTELRAYDAPAITAIPPAAVVVPAEPPAPQPSTTPTEVPHA
jgi:hypothetical protein